MPFFAMARPSRPWPRTTRAIAHSEYIITRIVNVPKTKLSESQWNFNKPNWAENDDNPIKLAERLKGVHVFLYHGLKQDAYNPGQSRLLAIKLKQLQKKSPEYNVVYKDNKYGAYGWLYWRGQIPDMMEFMNEKLAE